MASKVPSSDGIPGSARKVAHKGDGDDCFDHASKKGAAHGNSRVRVRKSLEDNEPA